MKRTAAVLVLTTAVLLGGAGAAHADTHARTHVRGHDAAMEGCGDGYVGDPLSTRLKYHSVVWAIHSDPDEGTLAIDAPRSWAFVRTPEGEGRFHDADGHDLLSLQVLESAGTTEDAMAARVRSLAGTSGLKVIGQHTQVVKSLQQRWSTLTYRYTNMGEPRTVKERWIAYAPSASAPAVLDLTVGGRSMDGNGLDALLAHVSPTAQLAG